MAIEVTLTLHKFADKKPCWLKYVLLLRNRDGYSVKNSLESVEVEHPYDIDKKKYNIDYYKWKYFCESSTHDFNDKDYWCESLLIP